MSFELIPDVLIRCQPISGIDLVFVFPYQSMKKEWEDCEDFSITMDYVHYIHRRLQMKAMNIMCSVIQDPIFDMVEASRQANFLPLSEEKLVQPLFFVNIKHRSYSVSLIHPSNLSESFMITLSKQSDTWIKEIKFHWEQFCFVTV